MFKLNKGIKKRLIIIGDCPEGKGRITSANSEKCQRCAREALLKDEIRKKSSFSENFNEYFALRLKENRSKKNKKENINRISSYWIIVNKTIDQNQRETNVSLFLFLKPIKITSGFKIIKVIKKINTLT